MEERKAVRKRDWETKIEKESKNERIAYKWNTE